jgi:hydroxyacylglutathione hydrolase
MPQIEILSSDVSDNFFYLIADDQRRAALVDPIDAGGAVDFVRDGDYTLEWVVNTHFHHDHIGGNPGVLEAFPDARLAAAADDSERIDSFQREQSAPTIERRLAGDDELTIGELTVEILATPGHTPGHISLLLEGERGRPHLFSGDTIFVSGAGNCSFGGDPHVLFRTFRDLLGELPDETRFYPGHDYAVRDLEFALSIEPEHEQARAALEKWRKRGDDSLPIVSLGEERQYNPFLRYDDPELRERLAAKHAELLDEMRAESDSEDEAVFCTLRELRNRW